MDHALQNRFLEIPKPAIVASVLVHLSLPLFLLFAQVMDSLGIPLFPKRDATKQVYQQFIQVDVVDLPDSLFKDKGAVDTTLPIVEQPKTVAEPAKALQEDKDLIKEAAPEMSEKEKKAKQKKEEATALREKDKQRKKEIEDALKKASQEADRERAMKDLLSKSGKSGRKKIAGNVMSKGTATTGSIGNAKEQYTALIVEAIRQHFHIYPWQQKKGLMGVISIELFPTGRVRSRKIVKPSGDGAFDSALLQAIDSAQPFPLPEDTALLGEDFDITFIP